MEIWKLQHEKYKNSMNDKKIISELEQLCKFSFEMEDEFCVSISFYKDDDAFGSTIRRHPLKQYIVDSISKMPNLKSVNLRKSKINRVPKFVSKKLEYLDLSCNNIHSISEADLDQPQLQFLNLGANQLSQLPNLSNLPLVTLKLHKNPLVKLPLIPNTIKSLNLYLNYKFDNIPDQVFDLSALQVFSFGVTKMNTLPSLYCFSDLRWLAMTVNEFEFLPDDICSLSKLEGLVLAKNKISKLPQFIGNMTNLKVLSLYENNLTNLPESFFDLNLKKLNLDKNCIFNKEKVKSVFSDIEFFRI